jgi:hypothetical protein
MNKVDLESITTTDQMVAKIKVGILPVVRFLRVIETYETYIDENMIARCISYERDDEITQLTFWTKDWDDHNEMVEKRRYYGLDGKGGNLGSRETNNHPERDGWKVTIYFDEKQVCPFVIIPR